MAKIGRNEPCPCGSGKKFKKCCLHKENRTAAPPPQQQISVQSEVSRLQELAVNKEESLKIVGVFIFLSTPAGDAWLLEMSEMDAVLVAQGGEKIDVEIQESKETIEVNWSHRFSIEDKKFKTTAYIDEAIKTYDGYPVKTIDLAIKEIQRNFSSQLLDSIHVDK